ncbi:MAG: hypothetical protein K2R98_08465 [Gemmataceae bacterium]|nr:hypothetical protein [Gemmataceae bacterium]
MPEGLIGLASGGRPDYPCQSNATAKRPPAGSVDAGRLYLTADGNARTLYRSTGLAWEQAARGWLVAAQTYYVATTGSDSNDGLTSSTPFLTIQKAVDVASALDNAGFAITIQIADGTYTGFVTLKSFVGSGAIVLQGNSSTPANVVISTTSGNGITATAVLGLYRLKDFAIQTTTSGHGLYQDQATATEFSGLRFGTVAAAYSHILLAGHSQTRATGNYTIAGNATGSHVAAYSGSSYFGSFRTITLTGTPAFGTTMYCERSSEIELVTTTFSGAATGTRYGAVLNSVITTGGGGAAYIPGNVAGATATGGQYV